MVSSLINFLIFYNIGFHLLLYTVYNIYIQYTPCKIVSWHKKRFAKNKVKDYKIEATRTGFENEEKMSTSIALEILSSMNEIASFLKLARASGNI